MYIGIRGSLYQVYFLVRVRMSFLRSSFLCIHFVISFLEWDEWPSPRGSGSLFFLSLHSFLMWLHSLFDLSWLSLFFVYSLFHYHSWYCFRSILFVSPPWFCLTVTYSRFATIFTSFLHISVSICFSSFPHYCYYIHIGTLRSMVYEFFYTYCILYMRAWVLIIRYLGLVFLHFYYPITLAYVMSCVLRPS